MSAFTMTERFLQRQARVAKRKADRAGAQRPATPLASATVTGTAATAATTTIPTTGASTMATPTTAPTIDTLAAAWGAQYPQVIAEARTHGWTPEATSLAILKAVQASRGPYYASAGPTHPQQFTPEMAQAGDARNADIHRQAVASAGKLRAYVAQQRGLGRSLSTLQADTEMEALGLY